MQNKLFAKGLYSIAEELRPAIADCVVRVWWSNLETIEALIEAQDEPVSQSQKAYLKKTLFGGMGSLNDLFIREDQDGDLLIGVNKRLDKKRNELYSLFMK